MSLTVSSGDTVDTITNITPRHVQFLTCFDLTRLISDQGVPLESIQSSLLSQLSDTQI